MKRFRELADKGRKLFAYQNAAACAGCALKNRCTQTTHRTVSRWEHEATLERMAAAVAAHPEKLAARKTLIEHCWGTLKWLLPGGFLVRGKIKVGAEVSLAHLGYNLKRALAVVGLEKLLAALKDIPTGGQPSPSATVLLSGVIRAAANAVIVEKTVWRSWLRAAPAVTPPGRP